MRRLSQATAVKFVDKKFNNHNSMLHFIPNHPFFAKHPIIKRVVKAFLFYVVFILTLSLIGAVLFGTDVGIFVIFFGVLGQVCMLSCGGPLFLFPIAVTGVIFIIIDIFSLDSIILKHKTRAALIILGVIIFFLGGIFIVRPFIRGTIADMKSERRLKDAEYYKREYLEIGEPTSEEQFIYARDNRIMVSGMNGKNARVIKEIPLDETKKIFSVSPKGTYYIAASKNDDEVYNSGIQKDAVPIAEVRAVSDNAFVMSITGDELRQDALKLCKWSFDEQFLACRYYRDYVKSKGKPTRKKLALFDVAHTFNTTIIYDEPPTYSAHDEWENFTWSDENLDFFYDQDEKIYRIDNIKEMSDSGFSIPPRRVLLDNLAPCFNTGLYHNKMFYCVTTTDRLPGVQKPSDNNFISTNNGFIIAWDAASINKTQNPIVVTKAPFFDSDDSPTLYPIDETYLAVNLKYSGFLLVNTKTGRANLGAIYYTTSGMVSPPMTLGSNIFHRAREGTVPVPYRGVQ